MADEHDPDEHDPGNAVPPGAMPQPLSDYDRAVRDKLQRIPEGVSSEAHQAENAKNDRDVAAMTRTVQPHSDAPSRAGVTGAGSGADGERG